jgi:hypothetical protein
MKDGGFFNNRCSCTRSHSQIFPLTNKIVIMYYTVSLHRSDAKIDTWCCSVWHHEVSNLSLMLHLTLVVPSQASQSVKFSISPMLMLNLALVESIKDYSVFASDLIINIIYLYSTAFVLCTAAQSHFNRTQF